MCACGCFKRKGGASHKERAEIEKVEKRKEGASGRQGMGRGGRVRCVCQAGMWITTAYTYIFYNCWNKTCVDQGHGEIISSCDHRESLLGTVFHNGGSRASSGIHCLL